MADYIATHPVGFPVMGIWADGMDGTDTNAVHRSSSHRHVVTAGDDGRVRLFNYPCVIDKAPARVMTGHSSHVANVRCVRI